jgi:hypothetical protein
MPMAPLPMAQRERLLGGGIDPKGRLEAYYWGAGPGQASRPRRDPLGQACAGAAHLAQRRVA